MNSIDSNMYERARVNQHPQAHHADDGWMDDVQDKKPFFHCISDPQLTMVVYFILTTNHSYVSSYLVPIK